ncbi:MAG: orotate phosphoribosyltransferase [Chitinispirillaceae bacterium]|nr:orotate phosphoribosyltransferase [Chitinispirillaceae bacterium]
METYKEQFIEFMVRSNVLTFGDFTTKSGRKTPFFINTGNYSTGVQLAALGRFYAETMQQAFPQKIDVLFGPAYKGIPLATATALSLATLFNRQVAFCFNRKEAKDHGEGGSLIGHRLHDNDTVVIVEDVTTAGTSIRESIPLLRAAARVNIVGMIVSVDRMERGAGTLGALAELREQFAMRTASIVTIAEIMEYLHNRSINGKILLDDAMYDKMVEYRRMYGAT